MTTLTVTAADVRPLDGAIVRKAIANEAMTVGQAVYIDGSSGGKPTVKKSTAAAVATSNMWGVVVAGAPEKNGSTTIALGDAVDVVTFGPIAGVAGTAGGFVWNGDTAGDLTDAVGTKSTIAGVMETTAVLFVRPMQAVRSA